MSRMNLVSDFEMLLSNYNIKSSKSFLKDQHIIQWHSKSKTKNNFENKIFINSIQNISRY